MQRIEDFPGHRLDDARIAQWVEPAMRAGYAAKGVVYLLLGGLAVRAALEARRPEDARGALEWLRDSSWGDLGLYAITFGLVAFVLWRLAQAVVDPEHKGHGPKGIALRIGRFASAVIYGSLALSAWQLAQGLAADGNPEQHWTAWLMAKPFGKYLAGGLGLGIAGYGLQQIVRGFRGHIDKHLSIADARMRERIVRFGRFGTAARGVVLVIVGGFLVEAARRASPEAAGGTGEALNALGNGWMLGVVALGLVAYGLFQLAQARYRRVAG